MKEATVIGYTISEKSFEKHSASSAAIFLEEITSAAEANKVLEKGQTFIDARDYEYDLRIIKDTQRRLRIAGQNLFGSREAHSDTIRKSKASCENIIQYIAQSENFPSDLLIYNSDTSTNIEIARNSKERNWLSIPIIVDSSIYLTNKLESSTPLQTNVYNNAPISIPNTDGKEWLPLPYKIGKFNSETGIWYIRTGYYENRQEDNVTESLEEDYGSSPTTKRVALDNTNGRIINVKFGILSAEGLAKLTKKTEKRLNKKPQTNKPKTSVKFNADDLKGIVYKIDRSPITRKLLPKKLHWMAANYNSYGLQRDITSFYHYTLGWIIMLYRLLPKEQFLELFGNMFDEDTTEALLAERYTAATTRVKQARTIITILRIATKHYRKGLSIEKHGN